VFKLADLKTVNGSPVRLNPNPATNPNSWRADADAIQQNIRKFQNILMRNGRYQNDSNGNPIEDKFRGFQLHFALLPDDRGFSGAMLGQNRLFGQISAWNYRVKSFKAKIQSVGGRQVSEIRPIEFYFAQAGTTSNVDFFERARGVDGA